MDTPDLAKTINRTNRIVGESAFVPNSIEVNAIKERGLGVYPSSEMVFARRFPQPRKTLRETSTKAISDY